ncbi:hypothetical protein L6R52_37530 [Myxococcota bacterium]|nr:hypothetical protein [Myxococcota bacterium]
MGDRSFQGLVGRAAERGLASSAEALFPENALGAPDWRATDLVARTKSYVALLPPKQARLVVALFAVTEWLVPVLGARLGRFSRLDAEVRRALVRRLRASRRYGLKLLGDSIKAVLTMTYLSHPLVMRHLGQYGACPAPADDALDVRLDALVARAHAHRAAGEEGP